MTVLNPKRLDANGRLHAGLVTRIKEKFIAYGWQDWMTEFQTYSSRGEDVCYRKRDNSCVMYGMDSGIANIGYLFRSFYGPFDSGPYNMEDWELIKSDRKDVICAQCLTPFSFMRSQDYLCPECRAYESDHV